MEELNYIAERIGIISLLCGIVFIIVSWIMYRFPPKKINYFYGYRTSASMKNQEVWDFSQKYAAVKMFQLGILMLCACLLNSLLNINQEQSVFLGIGLMIIGCGAMIFLTERAIKKKFPNDK